MDVKVCDRCRIIITGCEPADKAVFAVWFQCHVDLCRDCAAELRVMIRAWLVEKL